MFPHSCPHLTLLVLSWNNTTNHLKSTVKWDINFKAGIWVGVVVGITAFQEYITCKISPASYDKKKAKFKTKIKQKTHLYLKCNLNVLTDNCWVGH